MFKSLVLYGLSALLLAGGAARAAENCATYSVIPGDTLRLISEKYYGVRELSPIIYEANIGVIGANPNSIEIGMELAIPCRSNMRSPQPTAFLTLITPDIQPPEGGAPRFLAKAGETPFISRDGSGIIPDILAAALRAGGYDIPLEVERPMGITGVLQAASEPTALLSFPWARPDCGNVAMLSPQSAYVCANYTFSDPLFEITLGLFTPADSPLAGAETASRFAGASLCVPVFHTADLLNQNGIAATSATITLAPDFKTCLAGMDAGEFDAVLADYQSFGLIAPASSGLVDIPAFAQKTTLHAIAYNQNPAALEVVEIANAGLKKILMSGEWFGIVNQHLASMSN